MRVLLSVSELIGRFHPLIVHLPIGILLIALLLQWLSQKPKYGVSHGVLKLLWALGAASALVSCITGYLLSIHDSYDDTAVALHMWCGIAVAAVSLLLFAKVSARQNDAIYKTGAIALFILITATGHFGGALTHGSDYLFSALSTDAKEDSVVIKFIANVQEAQVYADVVKPILQTRCYNCHGPNKQKGDLRLDDSTGILKGGEDGPVVVAGNAENSDLVKSLLLPRDDKKHMPPKEKPQLTEKQVALIHWWIAQGAPFTKKIKELPQPDEMKPVLASLEHAEAKQEVKPEAVALVPAMPVAAADPKAIAVLKTFGVVVIPVAQGSNYLEANFTTATGMADSNMTLLLPLQKQLVSLKFNDCKIGDNVLQVIGKCTNLFALWLNNTAITDAGLKALQPLKNLQTLSLVGTPVTANGVAQLQGLPQLKTVYLYQTQIKSADWPALKKQFPHTLLDSGGYSVPTLATDTQVVKPPKM